MLCTCFAHVLQPMREQSEREQLALLFWLGTGPASSSAWMCTTECQQIHCIAYFAASTWRKCQGLLHLGWVPSSRSPLFYRTACPRVGAGTLRGFTWPRDWGRLFVLPSAFVDFTRPRGRRSVRSLPSSVMGNCPGTTPRASGDLTSSGGTEGTEVRLQ